MEGLYLIHTREFISTDKPIYKIGRGGNLHKRIKQYPNGSNLLFSHTCKNSVFCEAQLISIFKDKFVQEKFYGREYFSGECYDMIDIMYDYIKINNKKCINAENAKIIIKKEIKDEVKEVKEVKEIKEIKEIKDEVKEIKNEVKEEVKEKISYKPRIKSSIGPIKDRTCPKCNHIFKYPTMLRQHFEKSFHCLKDKDEIELYFNPKQLKCIKCKTIFSQASSLYRHQRTINCS